MSSSKKPILITGCSSGIGYTTAVFLARKGFEVIATMRTPETKGQPLLDIAKKEKLPLRVEKLDVNAPDEIKALRALVEKDYGHLHGLINNAGYALLGFFDALTDEEIRAQMETNFYGALAVTRAFLPLLTEQRPSCIINVSSLNGLDAVPGLSAYSASKFALEGFSEAIRFELLPYNIKVFLVEPGPFKTPIFTQNYQQAKNYEDPSLLTHKFAMSFAEFAQNIEPDPRIEKVSILIHKLLTGRKKSFRNPVGGGMRFWIRQNLPFSIVEKGLIKKLFPGE